MTAWPERALVALGALAGLAGVALSAVAAHLTGPGSLDVAARFLIAHAPVLMALPALVAAGILRRNAALAAGFAIAIGATLFCGDLAVRSLAGLVLVPMVAPTGGVILMAGWALVLAAAALGRGGVA